MTIRPQFAPRDPEGSNIMVDAIMKKLPIHTSQKEDDV